MSRIRLTGVAQKLLSINAAVALLVACVMIERASYQLTKSLTEDFESKGEAIALSLASMAENNMDSSLSTVQDAVESNLILTGVRYIYITDADGKVVVQSFQGQLPPGLSTGKPAALGEVSAEHRVKVNEHVDVETSSGLIKAIDVVAAISGGALGAVHVGMDRRVIEAHVARLQRSLILWGGLVALLGIVLGFFLIQWMVARPVRELTRITAQIVRKGDLTQKIGIHSNDEIGQLAATFDQMVSKLREIPTSLRTSVELLTDSVSHLSQSTAEQNETVMRQATALQETQVTTQEIKQTSILAAQRAASILEAADHADEVTRAGETAIEQSLGGLTDIRSLVDQIAAKISELGERTAQIGGITETVQGLADQSNMLALNAAIEAVRSGEHGRGFSVVAREIRNLANQSIQATTQVRRILEDIGEAIAKVVAISEQGAGKMETGLVQVRASGQQLQELALIVKDNTASVRQIAQAVSQQNAGISQVFLSVTDLSKMMDETVQRLRTTNDAAASLQEVSARVSQVVRSYRVE